MKRVIVAGASGLIGSELIALLIACKEIDQIVALVRAPLKLNHPKVIQEQVDYDKLDQHASSIHGLALYCCLGTTKKKTLDLMQYERVDHDYPVKLAQIALSNNVAQYHFVSAMGANARSNLFYNRIKGKTEEDLKAYPFKALHIYRPSLLTGERIEKRPLEKIFSNAMKALNPLLIGGLKNYQSIPAKTVAQAMLNQTLKNIDGIKVYQSHEIKKLA